MKSFIPLIAILLFTHSAYALVEGVADPYPFSVSRTCIPWQPGAATVSQIESAAWKHPHTQEILREAQSSFSPENYEYQGAHLASKWTCAITIQSGTHPQNATAVVIEFRFREKFGYRHEILCQHNLILSGTLELIAFDQRGGEASVTCFDPLDF